MQERRTEFQRKHAEDFLNQSDTLIKGKESERIVLIRKINKAKLLALLNAFELNTLMLLDMEIS